MALLLAAAVVGVAFAMPSCDGGIEIERSGEASPADDADQAGRTEDGSTAVSAPARTLVVHVDGAVASPGVYELSGDVLRVNDAVLAAGGLLEDADTTSMNLAAELVDGQKVLVPVRQPEAEAGEAGASGAASASAASSGSALVNINLATADQLQALSGVGEATARAIVEDREVHGPFSSIEDLMRVSGIGQKKFEKLRGQICV